MELTREERYTAVENLFKWRTTLVQKEWFLGGRHDREYRYTTKVPLYYNKDACLEFEACDVGLRVLLVIKQKNGPCNQFCLHSNHCYCESCDCDPCINHSNTIYDYYEYLDELEELLL